MENENHARLMRATMKVCDLKEQASLNKKQPNKVRNAIFAELYKAERDLMKAYWKVKQSGCQP